ncbi:MAG: pyruvate dehydrogenase complex E1 component subunit beta, partial [Rubrivivax sp.]
REALSRDPRVFVMGEDVGRYGGSYAVTQGLLAEFGESRVRDTPLSELGFVGAGVGAALGGARPIVEIMTVNFSLLAMDPIVNTAALLRHMSGGQYGVPLVIRMATGAGRQLAAQHSHSLEGWYAHVPGLRVLAPATLEDARGMLWPALCDPDPVLIFEHAQLYNLEDDLPDPPPEVDIAHARVRRPGRDLSIVAWGGCLPRALEAARQLAQEGLEAEVVDLRVLRPLDITAVVESVLRTQRLLVVDEAWRSGSLAAEIVAQVAETASHHLAVPPRRVCSAEVPMPYARHLEAAALPLPPRIVEAARALCAAAGRALPWGRPVAAGGTPHADSPGTPPAPTQVDLTLPSLGADMDDGTLLQWKVAVGDPVRRGQVVALVDTAKAAVEVESWHQGTVLALLAEPGTHMPVGTPIARLRVDGAQPQTAPGANPDTNTDTNTNTNTNTNRDTDTDTGTEAGAEAGTEAATDASATAGPPVTCSTETASTPGTPTSASAPAARAPATAPPSAMPARLAAMQQVTAAAMARAKREIPHLYLAEDLCVEAAAHWVEARNANRPPSQRVLAAALRLKAAALAAAVHPGFNGHWIDGAWRPAMAVHPGVAIAVRGGGLVAPALCDAGQMDLDTLSLALRDLVRRARTGTLRAAELNQATLTVTDLGETGVQQVLGIIHPPQVALIGYGRVADRPWAAPDGLRVGPVLTATLSADHRVSDGHRGAALLRTLAQWLQQPEALDGARPGQTPPVASSPAQAEDDERHAAPTRKVAP